MSRSDGYPAGSAQPALVPYLDTYLGWVRLYADPQVIACGTEEIALDQVEWVSYWAVRTSSSSLFGFWEENYAESHFRVGRGTWSWSWIPPSEGLAVTVSFGMHREDAPPQARTYLVNLSRLYLEPRLVIELVARVRRGETVTVCNGDLRVNQSGIGCSKPPISLPWESISGTQLYGGRVWIYQVGVGNPVWSVGQGYPNAVLIPALFTVLSRDATAAG